MNKMFSYGAVSGATALALAVPLLAQGTFAASSDSPAPADGQTTQQNLFMEKRTPPSLESMIEKDQAFLDNVDAMIVSAKSAISAHLSALKAAAALSDETARQEAIQKANEDLRTTTQGAMEANPDWKMAIPFGGPHGGHRGGHMKVRMSGMLEEKLGMTQEELKAALDSGKTIEEIAKEKGVTLPERPKFKLRGPMGQEDAPQQ